MRSIRNCSVCVVGGAGFLGSHLVNHLIDDRGCDVLVIDNLVAGHREYIHPKAKFVHHDITGSEEYLVNLLRLHKVEYTFNYAAYPYVPDSFERPIHVFNVNAFGAMKVINASHVAGTKGILQVSSAEIYGDSRFGPSSTDGKFVSITENAPITPHSSYGAAKAAIDAMVQVRWHEDKTPCIALRQFNCVGERETHPYIVPEIISQLSKLDDWTEYEKGVKTPRVHLGNNSYRDFLYAGDAVKIAVELLEKGEFGEVYNLGSESGIKMYDLAQLIGGLMGFKECTSTNYPGCVEVVKDISRIRPWEIWHLQSDNSKIQKATNYQRNVLVSLEEALKRTIRFYQDNGCRWCWEV